MKSKTNSYQVGDFVSVWRRDSKRHKWRLESSYVLLTFLKDNGFSFQSNDSNDRRGWTSSFFRGDGDWERMLGDPIFDVKVNKRSIPNECKDRV